MANAVILFAGFLILFAAPIYGQSELEWDDRFVPTNAPHTFCLTIAEYDSGLGPEIYVGGSSLEFGGIPSRGIGRWTRSGWRSVRSGITNSGNADVRALATFDDGHGPALYVGGRFTEIGGKPIRNLAKWDGQDFYDIPIPSGAIESLYVGTLDPNEGPQLFIVEIGRIRQWDGQRLKTLRSGDGIVECLAIFDAGSGPQLYAGGTFGEIGDRSGIEVLTANGWTRPGGGIPQLVTSLALYDSGTGTELYAGGNFSSAGNVPAENIAKWNGTNWSTVGGGLSGGIFTPVFSLAVHDDGFGEKLYASGSFHFAGGEVIPFLARWDGINWGAVGKTGINGAAYQMVSVIEPTGPALYLTGDFAVAGGKPSENFARWANRPFTIGDLNCDGVIDFFDITPFVFALTDRSAYLANYPACDDAAADIDGNGTASVSDIAPFVYMVLGQF